MDRVDGGDAASVAQLHVDDHQIRLASRRRGDRVGLGGLDAAHVVAHPFEHLAEQYADHGVVFHHQDAGRFHQFRRQAGACRPRRHGNRVRGSIIRGQRSAEKFDGPCPAVLARSVAYRRHGRNLQVLADAMINYLRTKEARQTGSETTQTPLIAAGRRHPEGGW